MKRKGSIHSEEQDEGYKNFNSFLEFFCRDEAFVNMMRSNARAAIYEFHNEIDKITNFNSEMKRKGPFHSEEQDEGYKNFNSFLGFFCRDEAFVNMMRSSAPVAINEFYNKRRGESSSRQPQSTQPETMNFELQISGELPATIFTNNKIETVSKGLLSVHLVDKRSNEIVNTGPLSSMKVKIVPLNGKFGEEAWSAGEFKSNIAPKRETRGDLLGGELTVTLNSGVGDIRGVFFTDTSLRQKLRIGAHSVEHGSSVKEAVSGPFVVKDRRGELYKKHHPPKFDDAVWRLVGIGKGGPFHNRLTFYGVNNVGDFVRMLETEPIRLRQILNICGEPWNQLEQHARSCEEDKDYYYTFEVSGENFQLVFDSLYRLQGWRYYSQNFDQLYDFDQLNKFDLMDKLLPNNLKKLAFDKKEALVKVYKYPLFGPPNAQANVSSQQCVAASPKMNFHHRLRVFIKFLMAMKSAQSRSAIKPKYLRTNSFGCLVVN